MTLKMYRLILCVMFGVVVASPWALNVNDFEPTMKFLSSAADPKTPLAMSYFHNQEVRKTDDDLTPKTTSLSSGNSQIENFTNKNRHSNGLMKTKTLHLSQIYDLQVSPTIYKESLQGHRDKFENLKDHRLAASNTKSHYPGRKGVERKRSKNKSHNKDNQNHKRGKQQSRQYEQDGIDVFHRQKNNFKSRFPERQRIEESETNHRDNNDDEDDEEFVPTRMYAQVRQYEHKSHLPSSVREPRLRKIVKDSRIHTVYMEEGYEDGAYDHAGEAKQAEESEHEEHHSRKKRFIDAAIDNVEIDTDFIGKNQYALGQQTEGTNKYPYYYQKDINNNSPLRYAQDMNDIPNKKEGNMAFYEAAAKVKCDENIAEINPIPKALDEGKNVTEQADLPKLPRLKNLGDKIDCFKIKFFGEDPLDSPIYKEEIIEPPRELFTETDFKDTERQLRNAPRKAKALETTPNKIATITEGSIDNQHQQDIDVEDVEELAESSFPSLPEAEALKMRRVTRRRKRPHYNNKQYHQYAYRPSYKSPSKFRGTTPQPLPPNTISEVYYKDQIKPSEQLNVFADVINHIQNMTRTDSIASTSEQHAHILPPNRLAPGPSKPPTHYRKKVKRKRPVMKSTQQLLTDYVRRTKKHPSRLQDDNLQVAQETNVGTVQVPSPDNLFEYKQHQHPIHYSTIDIPMNKFIVPGMQPPLAAEKPFIYSDFQNVDILKRRDWLSNHRLVRRRRGTKYTYSEIRRQPTRHKAQEEEEEEEPIDDDIDDYVPHRPTNYHYDPDTDRIVYDKKPTTETAPTVEEIIDEYVEEEPEKVTTSKPVLIIIPHRTVYHRDVLKKENGKTLVDFLMQLKSHPSYVPIEDPTTTTKEPPTTMIAIKSGSTKSPAFLKILEKLHSSDGYKHIDDEDEDMKSKKNKTTTTESPLEEEADEEEDEVPTNVQNSPGGQFQPINGQLQIFDINDYLPKVKSYTPRTSIDYSKYKTIERTTSRHSLSSRYNEDDELPLSTRPTTTAANAANYNTPPSRPKVFSPHTEEPQGNFDEELEEEIASTTTTTTTTTQAPKISIKLRGRPRSTRRPPRTTAKVASTTEGSGPTTVADAHVYTPATHRPASRVYPRRQRPKIRLKGTTTTSAPLGKNHTDDDITEEASDNHKRIIRRHDHNIPIPANHKPDYTPLTISKRMDNHPIILVQRQPRLVTPDIINYNRTAGEVQAESKPGEINPRKLFLRRKQFRFMTKTSDGKTIDMNSNSNGFNPSGNKMKSH